MDLDETWAFVGVVRAGSFTAASKNLDVPKSTLSRQITRLEERLGTRLLQRTTRKLGLTEAGRRFFGRCAPAMEMLEEAEHALLSESDVPRGLLRVAVPFDFARDWLSPRLAAFRARYPEITLHIDVSPRRVDLVTEQYDVAIRGGHLDDASVVARKLADSALLFCAAPSYLQVRGRPKSMKELSSHEILLFAEPPGGWRISGPRGTERFQADHWLRINEWGSLRRVAVEGGGVALAEVHSVQRDLDAGRLEHILSEYSLTGGGLYAIFPSSRHVPPKLRVFIDFLTEQPGGPLIAV